MALPQDYNVINKFPGLGHNVLIEIISELNDLHDIRQLLTVSQMTYNVIYHERFIHTLEAILFKNVSKRALIFEHQQQFIDIINPDLPEEVKNKRDIQILDLGAEQKGNVSILQKRIVKMTDISKHLAPDSQILFIPHAVIYINGLKQLKAQLCISNFDKTPEHIIKSEEWFKTFQLPPDNLTFEDVESQGFFALAKTEEGKLWSKGFRDDGSWDDTNPEVWRENPHFNYKGGLIPSSLGPSKIRQFCIEGNRAIVILENGAVFAYGDLHLFRSYPNLPIDGFIELTDSNNLKPVFSEDILGDLSGAEGQFGIFGTYQVVKYFRDAQAFLTADGIVIQFNYPEHEKSKNSFTPIDPKFFYGEKVIYINNCHGGENYLAESGRLIITATEYFEMSKLFITKLANPIRKEFLPFNLNELQTLILARKQYFTSLQKDGKILNFRFGDNTARDVTHFITQLAKINPDEPDMKIKNFQYGEQVIFLFD